MENIIETVLSLYPLPLLPAAAGLALLVIGGLLFVRKGKFVQALKKVSADPDLQLTEFCAKYSLKRISSGAKSVIALSRREKVNLPELLGLTALWVDQCRRKNSSRLMERVLEFAPERGLFFLFKAALSDKKTAARLNRYLDNNGELLKLRKIALSGAGAEFDGSAAWELFRERRDEIREMTGDPEWASRFFAVTMLLHDDDERSLRAVAESFEDPHGLIRKTVVAGAPREEGLFDTLMDLLLNDPVFEVRRAARERIEADFPDRYAPSLGDLTNEQTLHVIQLLSPQSAEDQNLALTVLEEGDAELRQSAARYLQECGVLNRLFRESHLEDRAELERHSLLLMNALKVKVSPFLNELKRVNEPGPLLLASRLLGKAGPRPLLTVLARKVFALDRVVKLNPEHREIYHNTLACIGERGNDESFKLLADEMVKVKDDGELLLPILESLPERGADYFMEGLSGFLKDPGFPHGEELRSALLTMPESDVTDLVMDIIQKGRDVYSHGVRIQALKLLGEMKSGLCLQVILENLPILPLDEAREFTKLLSDYSEDLFNERAASLLGAVDAHTRASLIVSLPATGKKAFLKEIRTALEDADGEVRIAAVWALAEYGESKELARCVNMLRDPVEQVRTEVARALGTAGTAAAMGDLKALLNDENETSTVKAGVINGLSQARGAEPVNILAEKIAADDEYKPQCIRALSRMADKKSLTAMVEQFKDGDPQLRDDLSKVFKIMGRTGEDLMTELLKEDIPSLHKYIIQVLDHTGFIESHIRLIKNRDPRVRRRSAAFLASVKTTAAFRGMVLAARDPNRDVRIEVVKALESLSTPEGEEILKELEQDPDRKVRKYTLWAMERVKSKSLV